MQKYSEAYMTCLKSKALPYKLQYNRDLVEGSPQAKDGIRSRSGGGFAELDRSFSSPSFVPPTEGYYRPINQQDFYVWSAFHTNSQKAQQNQFCALESRFYPMNHEYNFPMDDRFKSVPFRMSSQGYQPGFQFQEFQYFVVIDFEATCDKEKNPQPQEIIEFPSVLVNSMTGQVEDYFQIYVRPTCNQLLSDFCKELTGIQQGQVCIN
jgi:ERI1 exoribonuclease 2